MRDWRIKILGIAFVVYVLAIGYRTKAHMRVDIPNLRQQLTSLETRYVALERSHALLESRQTLLKNITCGYCHHNKVEWEGSRHGEGE